MVYDLCNHGPPACTEFVPTTYQNSRWHAGNSSDMSFARLSMLPPSAATSDSSGFPCSQVASVDTTSYTHEKTPPPPPTYPNHLARPDPARSTVIRQSFLAGSTVEHWKKDKRLTLKRELHSWPIYLGQRVSRRPPDLQPCMSGVSLVRPPLHAPSHMRAGAPLLTGIGLASELARNCCEPGGWLLSTASRVPLFVGLVQQHDAPSLLSLSLSLCLLSLVLVTFLPLGVWPRMALADADAECREVPECQMIPAPAGQVRLRDRERRMRRQPSRVWWSCLTIGGGWLSNEGTAFANPHPPSRLWAPEMAVPPASSTAS
ncbi:hypothetical protein LZ32DRAFT_265914 [Colletotrichum eremochloae]|nr:hypothetical protein LZ32DRAFT_265914 [Colletotrichum eremochloae]